MKHDYYGYEDIQQLKQAGFNIEDSNIRFIYGNQVSNNICSVCDDLTNSAYYKTISPIMLFELLPNKITNTTFLCERVVYMKRIIGNECAYYSETSDDYGYLSGSVFDSYDLKQNILHFALFVAKEYPNLIGITNKDFSLNKNELMLVRDDKSESWCIRAFAMYTSQGQIIDTECDSWEYVIPYNDETARLLGTSDFPGNKLYNFVNKDTCL